MTALRDPCFEAEETTKKKSFRRLLAPRDDMTVAVTMNIGME